MLPKVGFVEKRHDKRCRRPLLHCGNTRRVLKVVRFRSTVVGRWVKTIQLLWEQADFDFIVGQCPVSDDDSARWIPTRHNTLSDGLVKVCCLGTVSDDDSGPLVAPGQVPVPPPSALFIAATFCLSSSFTRRDVFKSKMI